MGQAAELRTRDDRFQIGFAAAVLVLKNNGKQN
jgi:hypothetical protein